MSTRGNLGLAVGCLGVCGTLLASLRVGDSFDKALAIALVAGGAAVVVGILGVVALRLTARRPLAVQGVIVALTPVGAVSAGALAASHLMMAATRPVAALAVVVVSAGTVGILTSLALTSRLRAASLRLIEATRQIGEGDLRTRVEAPPGEEFAALARELESMQEQLEASLGRERAVADARRKLVSWISHDLRTPLARIKAIVEALDDGVVFRPGEVSLYHRQLSAESDRLAALVDDLFELNRITAGALELEDERVDVTQLVSEVVASFLVVADSRDISLSAVCEPLEADVDVSSRHLERALGNLLDNALRHTPPGGAVDVVVALRGAGVVVAIDDGCGGVNVDAIESYLGAGSGEPSSEGNGRPAYGLAIAKGLVEAQGGRLAVERTGRGCRLAVTLPLAVSHARAPLATVEAAT
jgi:signal transduction histidine kinase